MHTTLQLLHRFACLTCISLTIMLFSCGGDDDENIHFGPVKLGKYESRIEVPKMLNSGTQFITHTTKENGHDVLGYCVEYDLGKRHSRWVAFRFDGETRERQVNSRANSWRDDPMLDSKYHIGGNAYQGGYARGHLCASYDRRYSLEAEDATYYMTNMSPMYYEFNGNYWTIFEGFIQDKGRNPLSVNDTLYVVKGGTIENGQTIGTCRTSNGSTTVVPEHYFIAAVMYRGGNYSGIGFWVEHKNYSASAKFNKNTELRKCSMNIDELEELTGIDFFCNIPDDKEQEMERENIESIRRTWGL